MLVAKTLEYPLRRVALLAVNRPVLNQNTIDDIREGASVPVQLRALRRLTAPVTRRNRIRQYLDNRLAVDPEPPSRSPSAQSLSMTRQPHTAI